MRIIIVCLTLLVFSNFSYAGEDDAPEPTIDYLEMGPKFTVNLDQPRKYLAVSVQVMVEGEKNIERLKKHIPLLRHQLIMSYSGRPLAELQTMEQREALRLETKKIIIGALDESSNSDGIRDIFFTEFLVN